MSTLADLFSADSPPPTPGSSRRAAGEALFLSPGGSSPSRTPAKRRRVSHSPPPSPGPGTWGESGDPAHDFDRDLGETLDPETGAGPSNRDEYGLDEVGVRALAEVLDAPSGGGRDALALDDDDDADAKPRRVVAKVDAERLMGRWGLPALLEEARKFKVGGKGRETRDLRRLLDVYQMWAHGMFPKGNFGYTVGRVEVVCRTGRMQSAIAGMREEYEREREGGKGGGDEEGGTGGDGGGEGGEEGEGEEGVVRDGGEVEPDVWVEGDVEGDDRDVSSLQQGSGPRGKTPLFDNNDNDDGPDFDEMLALEEMERDSALQKRAPEMDFGDGPLDIEEEDDW